MEFEINWKFSFKLIFKFKLDMKVNINFEMRILYKNSLAPMGHHIIFTLLERSFIVHI